MELLVTLSGYVGIAIDNAMLYRSLARKVEEYERLKEFRENIVESINVGHSGGGSGRSRGKLELADRKAHRDFARRRAWAASLASCFPADLCEQLEPARGEAGVHNIYKFVLRLRARRPRT